MKYGSDEDYPVPSGPCEDAAEVGCQRFEPERDFDRGDGRQPGYLQFYDIARNWVRLAPSSAAMRHCAWLFVDPPPDQRVDQPTPGGMVHPARGPASIELCRGMAWELWCALGRMLAEPVAPELACEWTVWPPDGVTRVIESSNNACRLRCACGQVVDGGANSHGGSAWGNGQFQAAITLFAGDPANQEAVEHFMSCEAHQGQDPTNRTQVWVGPPSFDPPRLPW